MVPYFSQVCFFSTFLPLCGVVGSQRHREGQAALCGREEGAGPLHGITCQEASRGTFADAPLA